MSRKLLVLLACVAALVPVTIGYAQGTPPDRINAALADLSARAGRTLALSDLSGWRWSQASYPDTSLGCPQPGQAYAQVATAGYQFILNYNGATYDYRASADGAILFLCSGPETVPAAPAQPIFTPTVAPQEGRAVCAGAMNTRLRVGIMARVRLDGLPVNIRVEPASGSARSGQMNPGDTFSITGGPQCGQNLVWWQVAFEAINGWAAEGADGIYWIEPTAQLAPTVTPQTTTAIQTPGAAPVSEIPQIHSLPGDNQPPITAGNARQMARYIELPTNEAINGLAWSGQYLAATSLTGIRLYDMLALQQPPRLFQVPNGPTYAAAFNPAGSLMVSGHNDGTVRLWDIAVGGLRAVLRDHTQPVRTVVFSPSGLVIASAGGNETTGADSAIRLWNVTDQSLLATLEGHSGAVTVLAFSPDGSMLASAGLDQTVRLWDVASAAPGTIMEGHAGPVRVVTFNADGTWLASAGDDGTIQLWEIGEGTPVILEGHTGGVRAVAFSPDGSLLISAGAEDGAIRFWDIATQTQAAELSRDDYGGGVDAVITGLVLRADGVMLAFATAEGERGMIRIWGVGP